LHLGPLPSGFARPSDLFYVTQHNTVYLFSAREKEKKEKLDKEKGKTPPQARVSTSRKKLDKKRERDYTEPL